MKMNKIRSRGKGRAQYFTLDPPLKEYRLTPPPLQAGRKRQYFKSDELFEKDNDRHQRKV